MRPPDFFLSSEFKVADPLLVVVPTAALQLWESELAFWAPGHFNSVVTYAGSPAARAVILEHELWHDASATDNKAKVGGRTPLGCAPCSQVCFRVGPFSQTARACRLQL
jgi:hypothetical protein